MYVCRYPFGVGEERPYEVRSQETTNKSVILLGAGASAAAGCPLARGFIDKARDLLAGRYLEDDERENIEFIVDRYNEFWRRLRYTEEDLENIENLLALADLEQFVEPANSDLHVRIRTFIETVLSRTGKLPNPSSYRWLDRSNQNPEAPYLGLVEFAARLPGQVTMITLNYDCLLEYTCHCTGVSFAYPSPGGVDSPEKLQIIKLHGSLNWGQCSTPGCGLGTKTVVCPLEFVTSGSDTGWVRRVKPKCAECGQLLDPMIIPPIGFKNLSSDHLKATWQAAYRHLSQAESLMALGYSLPPSDGHVRNLLHLGLREVPDGFSHALVVLGNDEAAAQRWQSFFRQSWARSRLDIRRTQINRIIDSVIGASLSIRPQETRSLLPMSLYFDKSRCSDETMRRIANDLGISRFSTSSLHATASKQRTGKLTDDAQEQAYVALLTKLGLGWTAGTTILPDQVY